MDRLSKKEEDQLKNVLNEIGLEKPSAKFTGKVMALIETELDKKLKKPTPLLSRKGWAIILFVFIACSSLIFFYPNEGIEWFTRLKRLNMGLPHHLFDTIKISKTTILAVSLMGLFLLQLPFLMQLVNKQRSIK